jgi:hypothetical protein
MTMKIASSYKLTMKIASSYKLSSKVFSRAPINFWEPVEVEEVSTTKPLYDDAICHEVKYDPAKK